MRKISKCIISIITALAIASSYICGVSVLAVSDNDVKAKTHLDFSHLDPMEVNYWDLLSQYNQAGYEDYAGQNIEIPISDARLLNGTLEFFEYESKNAIKWDEEDSSLEWQITVPEDALYNIEIDYYAYNDKSTDIQRELNIDGILPCMEYSNIRFTRLFEDDGEIRVDVNGDESAPKCKQIYAWQTLRIADFNGYYSAPLKLYLTKGTHLITFKMRGSQPIAIGGIRLTAPSVIKSYSEIKNQYDINGYKAAEAEVIVMEGEDSLYRSSASMRLESASDLSCTPSDIKNEKINIVGGNYWKSSRQTITWEINAETDGLYRLGFNLYSYYNYGLPSYRKIEIDGKVPFSELEEYCFLPGTKWRNEFLMDDEKNPYLFYLTKGKHTLSMSIVAGDMTEVIRQLDKDMDILSDLYLDITLITTSDPDENYDYELDERIPELMDTLNSLYENLRSSADLIKSVCKNDKALTYSEMQNTLEDYEILMEDVFEIPSNLEQFTTMITQYGNWVTQLAASTLSIDKLVIAPADFEYEPVKVSVFKKALSTAAKFLATFVNDYSSVIGSGVYDKDMKTIDVWYGGTQIWANEIENLIEADFIPKNNIQVRFKLTPTAQVSTGINAMLLAILSGTAPDAVLEAASVEDYMMRNQCYDLSSFTDFEEVKKSYPEVCFNPLTYKGRVYAFPLTMDMNFMFYRTDIFKEFGLTPPKTWDEMIDTVIPRLAENNMTLSTSPGYEILLYQHGGEYYNEDMTESLVASQISWQAFKMHCDFYTMYGVPKTANFFNRFRTGETPVGFGNIASYIQFVYGAPELTGRWDIAVMPGVLREDGSINNNIGGLTTTSAIIMADAKNPNEAWDFIKWYMSTDVQLEFSEIREAKLDMSARLLSTNIEAFSSLDWDSEHLDVFLESMEETKAYNPILGNYYTTRFISYAFNNVVISRTMSEREALEYAQENINKELERRRNSKS